eukprot:s678_g13.t4
MPRALAPALCLRCYSRAILAPQLRRYADAAALAAHERADELPERARNKGISSADPSPGQVVELFGTEDVESFPRLQKPFVDRIWLSAKAGNGGSPAPNANRRPHLPTGPGYGGHGGNVILKATTQIESFLDVPEKINAEHGGDGHDSSRGKSGKDYVLQVPLGTIIRERVFSGERTPEGRRIFLPQFRYQFLRHEDTYIVAKGGTGGIGPKSFKKGDSRRPTHGQRARLELELRLMNDAALGLVASKLQRRGSAWAYKDFYGTKLFVDGDTHSISEVKEAIGMLRKKGLDVWTTVYAEPRREDNKNWGEFFKGADTSFCPVPRREDLGEANDEQMMADMRLLACSTARSATSARLAIALLTSDTDFLETVAFATGLGIDTMVLIPHRHVNTTQAYRGQGFQVMPILQRELCSPKVRAILHGDGSGSEEEAEGIKPLLQDLGYCQPSPGPREARPFLGHAAAKLWYNEGLADIEVFPAPLAIATLHQLVQNQGAKGVKSGKWQRYHDNLAFVLPCAARRGGSKASAMRIYGSLRDRQIYQGGGPFILRTSEDLVPRVLQRLGYLDNDLNGSLAEAILVFVNTNYNKGTLRKMNLLPKVSDSADLAAKKLHQAFMSTASPGIWQVVPSDRFLRQLLQKRGFTDDSLDANPDELMKAMQRYAEDAQLPRMESYNGYAFRIKQSLQELSSDPSRTGVGMPNAGKTSLLAALSRAHTRIGPEEFSTTRPHVGVIKFRDRVEIRLCDLPGLSEGAHEDKLMGRRILRHMYRSRALAFVVNVARGESSEHDVLAEVEMLREEAIRFEPLNAEKPWMVIGTKCDLLHRDPLFHLDSLFYRLRARYGAEVPVVGTSSRFGLGLTRTVRILRQLIYPDMLEARPRLGADPELQRQPKVLHGPYLGPLPSLGEYADPRTPLPEPEPDVPKLTP